MKTIINSPITDFSLPAFHNGEFTTISLEDIKKQWSVLFFYSNDFCFVCPTELADIADIYNELQEMGVQVYGISLDSQYAHKAWHNTSPSVNKIRFPMISDRTGRLGRTLGVISPEGGIIRSTFFINTEGKIKMAEYHDNGIGRNASELLRKVKLFVG